MPLESIQIDSSNKTYAIQKKIHTFFLLLSSSILKLYYLCNYEYSLSEIWSYSSPLNLLSNLTGLTRFRFFMTKLCLISHNDLIMDYFRRANLYDMPRVIVSSFGSEIDTKETKVHVLVENFYIIVIRCSEKKRVMMIFPWSPL